MKKVLCVMLSVFLMFSLASCSDASGDVQTSSTINAEDELSRIENKQDNTSCDDDEYDESKQAGVTVYITKSGTKYHRYGCQHLSKSCLAINLSDAINKGYEPCSKCNPPRK